MAGMARVSLAAEASCVSSCTWTLLNSESFTAKSYELGLITGTELLQRVSLRWEVSAVQLASKLQKTIRRSTS